MKFSKKFEEDYQFYLDNIENSFFHRFNRFSKFIIFNKNGLTAKECFNVYDSKGLLKPCKEVDLFKSLNNVKIDINTYLKEIADLLAITKVLSIKVYEEDREEILKSFRGSLPKWVIRSLDNQTEKFYKNHI